ncbi:MAG: HypC/HybG/HupF family hydrogenase formation chaperone [Anaerolineae bacterium]|nr:HypC/HybG/HupF family hydrogenase formation chaperone [Anaerolineae bacterium]
MCLAIPLRIQKIEGTMAKVELGGVLRDVSLVLTPEAKEGDYVLVHTGFAISVLNEKEAQETLALFAELEEATRQLEEEEATDSAGGEPAP